MKLRRILAGFLAGAIAMTSSVVMSVTAGAEDNVVSYDTAGTYATVTANNTTAWGIGVNITINPLEYLTTDEAATVESVKVNVNKTAGAAKYKFGFNTSSSGGYVSEENYIEFSEEAGDFSNTHDVSAVTEAAGFNYIQLGCDWINHGVTFTITSIEFLDSTGTTVAKAQNADNKPADQTGTKIAITANEPWNYQTTFAVSVDGLTKGTSTAADVLSTAQNLTITFPVNSAYVGSEKFDISKISYQVAPKVYKQIDEDNADWPWGPVGSGSYDSTTGTVTITADLSESTALAAANADYLFDSIEVVCMVSLDDTSGTVNLYIGDVTAEAEAPATPTTYDITFNVSSANGTVTSDKETAAAGDKVTLTVTPAENYQLEADSLKVAAENGEVVEVTENEDGTYSFTMPERNVAVNAEFTTREYKLTAKEVANGKILHFIVNSTAHDTAPAGVEVEIGALAEQYYKFGSADIEGVTTKTTSTITERTFIMPAEDVIVTPKFVVDVDYVKLLVDPSVENYATVTKPSTYTVADYKAEIEKKVANLEFNDITVDVSALKETKATTDATGSITGTVTFKTGEETITTLTANVTLDKAPTDPVDVAKEAVEAYLAKVTFDNDFHATNQAKAIEAEVAKVAPEVRVDANFTVKVATEEAEGSVKGRIMLVADGSELKTIEVNKTIAKLPAKDLVYADNQGMLVALKADGTVLTQKATQANGQLSQRFVKKINKADLEGAKEIQYKFSDGTKSLTKTDKFYYEKVAGIPSGETEVFLSATMKNIPVGVKVTCEITIIK